MNSNEQESAEAKNERNAPDRRSRPTPLFSRHMFFGRRRWNRRATDPRLNYYVDRYSIRAYAAVIVILFLCAADAAFTIYHLNRGASEVNPIMRFTLSFGNLHFIIIKYALTASGLFVLLTHKNFAIARFSTVVIIGMYCLLLAYHLSPLVLEIVS